jgi:hypothetical protein
MRRINGILVLDGFFVPSTNTVILRLIKNGFGSEDRHYENLLLLRTANMATALYDGRPFLRVASITTDMFLGGRHWPA